MEVARVPVIGKYGLALREGYRMRRLRSAGKLCIGNVEADAVMNVIFYGVLFVCSDALPSDHRVVRFGVEILRISRMPAVFEGDNVVFLVVCSLCISESVLSDLLNLQPGGVAWRGTNRAR